MPDDDNLWWREGVFYHIYLRSFADSDGDGLGDLPGLIARLDHLAGAPDSLGVDALWLSPCYPSPDKDFGYDVADYRDIDPRYGTLADFDRLLAEAHRRGLRVMLDLVFNHTSDQHAWFRESRRRRDSPRRDWYLWADPRPGLFGPRRPNNWRSIFGGPGWAWDESTRQYYFHQFLPEQPDLNWHNPAVRAEMMDVARFWLARGVDGFRLDVHSSWFKHHDRPDNPALPGGLGGFFGQRHLYDTNQPELAEALATFRDLLDSFPGRAAVGEPLMLSPEATAAQCHARALHLTFNFAFSESRWNPAAFLRQILRWEAALAESGWPCYVFSNHDGLRRAVSRYGGRHPDAVARVAAALLLTLRGTPFVYYGEEIALPDTRLRRSQLQDPVSRHYWPIYQRDGGRAPLPWDDSPHGGFTSGQPWMPMHPGCRERNVAAQRADPGSALHFYRALLALRRAAPALRRGAFVPLTSRPRRGLAYLRQDGEQRALVALNLSASPAQLSFDAPAPAERWRGALGTHAGAAARLRPEGISMQPHEVAIFLNH